MTQGASVNLTNDPRVRGRAIAEIRASLREPDQVAYLELRTQELLEQAYGGCSPQFRGGRFTEGRPPNMAARNLAAVLAEFAKSLKPDPRPFIRAFDPPPAQAPERRPRRYRARAR